MKRYVESENRSQSTLFPESLDDYIAEDNPVRVVDVFVEEDLPPHGEIKVFSWGLAFLVSNPEDVTVSHSDGVGEIQFLTPVPQFIWGNEGVFFSYRHTTYALLALVLIGFGAAGIVHLKARRVRGNA